MARPPHCSIPARSVLNLRSPEHPVPPARRPPRRLDLRPRSRHSAARKSFRSPIARRIRPRRPHRRSRRGRSDSLLRALHPARIARSRRPHRMVRAPELSGARRRHRPQSRTDRAVVRRYGCRHHTVPLHRCRRHSHGQASPARVVAAPLARSRGNQRPSGRRRSRRERNHLARRVAPRPRWRPGSRTPLEPRHAGNRESPRRSGPCIVARENSGNQNCGLTTWLPRG